MNPAPAAANVAPAAPVVDDVITNYDDYLAAKDEREIDRMVSAGLIETDEEAAAASSAAPAPMEAR